MHFRKVNNITGWAVGIIACITYIVTREATASFWDCGEFIACANEMGLPHPPGSPLFLMLGRLFIVLFSGGNAANVASSVNLMSALASGFTILFLFWTITHFARKMFVKAGENLNGTQLFLVMSAGVVGSLAYTFSDTFWYSAVEGEVYALASFFTAILVWAMLKWEHADELAQNTTQKNRADRWIIFIFFMIGLSITVHLLNLLTIPAIVMIYYFRRYEYKRKGAIMAFLVSIAITGLTLWGFVYLLPRWSASFDRIFVNSFGLPFFWGFAFFFILLGLLCWWGIRWSAKKGMKMLRLVIWSFIFMMAGYSTYVTTLIRSNANPVIDMNDVDNPMSLAYYFGREQYGSAPLIYGPHFLAQYRDADRDGRVDFTEGRMRYAKDPSGKQKYVQLGRDGKPLYEKEDMMLFPRIWDASDEQNHASTYIRWLGIEGYQDPRTGQATYEDPTYAQNLEWFFTYQLSHMYFRYLMWNFAGRQNDIQGMGSKAEGNWISGIPFIDNSRLGDQSMLPESIRTNKANNKLFMLPFFLGVLGFVYQFLRHKKDWLVSFLLFFFTGLAISLYLNMPGPQPRERDYAFVGSFYAFAIWIGLAVVAFYKLLKEDRQTLINTIVYGSGLTLVIVLLSTLPGAGGGVLISSVAAAAAYALFTGIAYYLLKAVYSSGKKDKLAAYGSAVICMIVPLLMLQQEWDDHDRGKKTLARDTAKNYLESCPPNAILFSFGDNDTYPLWYAQEVEGVRPDIRLINNSLLGIDWYINQLRYAVNKSKPLNIYFSPEEILGDKRPYLRYQANPNVQNLFVNLDEAMRELKKPQYEQFFPFKKFKVPVDTLVARASGILSKEDIPLTEMQFEIPQDKNVIARSDLIILNIIASVKWERPICFTSPFGELGFYQYLRKEGQVYKLVPANPNFQNRNWVADNALRQLRLGGIFLNENTEASYDILMNKFVSESSKITGVYFDEENRSHLLRMRAVFAETAGNLADKGRKEDARKLLDQYESLVDSANLPYAMYSRFGMHNQNAVIFLEACYKAEHSELAEKVRLSLEKDFDEHKKYFKYLNDSKPELYTSMQNDDQIYQALFQVYTAVLRRYAPDKIPKQEPLPGQQNMPALPMIDTSANADTNKKDS